MSVVIYGVWKYKKINIVIKKSNDIVFLNIYYCFLIYEKTYNLKILSKLIQYKTLKVSYELKT